MSGGYVLQRAEDGKFVNWPGRAKSYTPIRSRARVFPTAEDAKAFACGNERVVALDA